MIKRERNKIAREASGSLSVTLPLNDDELNENSTTHCARRYVTPIESGVLRLELIDLSRYSGVIYHQCIIVYLDIHQGMDLH